MVFGKHILLIFFYIFLFKMAADKKLCISFYGTMLKKSINKRRGTRAPTYKLTLLNLWL